MAGATCKRCGTAGLMWRQARKPPFKFYLVWPSDPGTVVLHKCSTVNGKVIAQSREDAIAESAKFAADRAAAKITAQAAPQVQPEAPQAAAKAAKATTKATGKAASRTATDGGQVSKPIKVTLEDLPTGGTAAPTASLTDLMTSLRAAGFTAAECLEAAKAQGLIK